MSNRNIVKIWSALLAAIFILAFTGALTPGLQVFLSFLSVIVQIWAMVRLWKTESAKEDK